MQITTLSGSEAQIRIPAGRVQDIRPNTQNKNHHHDRLYFQRYWSTPGKPHNWIVLDLRHGQLRKRETTVWWILDQAKTIITYNKNIILCHHPYDRKIPYFHIGIHIVKMINGH